MESRTGEIPHFGRFRFEFLYVIFTELAQAGLVGLANNGCWKDLRDGDQGDGRYVAPAARAGALDAGANLT